MWHGADFAIFGMSSHLPASLVWPKPSLDMAQLWRGKLMNICMPCTTQHFGVGYRGRVSPICLLWNVLLPCAWCTVQVWCYGGPLLLGKNYPAASSCQQLLLFPASIEHSAVQQTPGINVAHHSHQLCNEFSCTATFKCAKLQVFKRQSSATTARSFAMFSEAVILW